MKHSRAFYYLLISYLLVIGGLFLFSYTQVDLSLTLSQSSIIQTIEKGFQYVGYYQRPLATALFCGLLVLLFALYAGTIMVSIRQKITQSQMWKIVLAISGILLFSYPAAL